MIGIGGRRGDDHLFDRTFDVLACFRPGGKQPGGLHHDLRAHGAPIELRRVLDLEYAETLSVNRDRVVGMLHGVGQIAKDRIVFQQVSQSLRIGDVVHGHELDCRVVERRAHDVAADSPEAVNPNLDGHSSSESKFPDLSRRQSRAD